MNKFIKASEVPRELFANDNSYKAGLFALAAMEKLQALVESGHWIFFEEQLYQKLNVKVEVSDDNFSISIQSVCFVGDQHMEVKNRYKVWCTKTEIKKFLKDIKVFHPKSAKSFI